MKEKKNVEIENNSITNPETIHIIKKKIIFFQDLIQRTILHVQKNKTFDILGVNDVNLCLENLTNINNKLNDVSLENQSNLNMDVFVNKLQIINNDISSLLKSYGTLYLDDLLTVCFGNSNIHLLNNDLDKSKFDLLQKYFHPISYKVVNLKDVNENYFILQENSEKISSMHCLDVVDSYKQFHMKVYGIKIYLLNTSCNKCILVNGVIDDVCIDFLNSKFIKEKEKDILFHLPDQDIYKSSNFNKFLSSLLVKDYLMYDFNTIYNKYSGYLSNIQVFKQKPLLQIIKEFVSSDTYYKRMILIQLLIKNDNPEYQYLCYLLYDLLSNDNNEKIDTTEQIILFDSFPWKIKNYFKSAMSKTIQYTMELLNYDTNKVALEQQICLMNVSESVKEKAMTKLKEIKGKSEDSGSKARLYLEGLLKIPFGMYKREPILSIMDTIKSNFHLMVNKYKKETIFGNFICKEKYTSIEITIFMNKIYKEINEKHNFHSIKISINAMHKSDLIDNINKINNIIVEKKINIKKLFFSGKTKSELKEMILKFVEENTCILDFETKNSLISTTKIINNNINENYQCIKKDLDNLSLSFNSINDYISDVKTTLDKAVYGHENAKKQIEIIIGQWMNGEQDGYCFGFEGPPGVGKTSLAKRGLSKCLVDETGNERPFSMIQMGGDCNGSTLHGHNYTYIGSTWGSIVQIIIDKKCMNPIIFIDEVDKISKTEHGKEIVGILTHLLDSTQNDCFQDKYFNGIDLDLSKALFILSYNDAEEIDKILLDRIHRIKFDNLSLDDKIIISNRHILPDIYKKMGLENVVEFGEDILKFIIENYTSEAGVRKLKEILFQIIGEINIDVLKNKNNYTEIPIQITIEDLKNKYFKDKREIKFTQIENESQIGIINALWANSLGQGGTLPIQSQFVPSENFLHLTLTGSQGIVMKETMNVALTVAWNLTSLDSQHLLMEKYNDIKNNKIYGIHLHTPDCSTPKDGPSATAAITVTIYSLFNNIKIKNDIGITGELNFSGRVTEIGGLEYKFLGGIKCGIKAFIYPMENQKDYEKFLIKYKNNKIIDNILFYPVNTIQEVFELILVK
jgi:ATP-dependent Lon protease